MKPLKSLRELVKGRIYCVELKTPYLLTGKKTFYLEYIRDQSSIYVQDLPGDERIFGFKRVSNNQRINLLKNYIKRIDELTEEEADAARL